MAQRGENMNKTTRSSILVPLALTAALLSSVPFSTVAAEKVPQSDSLSDSGLPDGWLLWHTYSNYSALDSKLYLRAPDGTTETIDGAFLHAMNGVFGSSPAQITFMAIDPTADEWDIFFYDHGDIINLTQSSGFRNEDPKFSPDGKNIVFKRGYWSDQTDDFVYDLAMIDIETREVSMITSTPDEEAMPCFSADGSQIYYAGYKDGIGAIYRLDLETGQTEPIYSENGINAYYPVCKDDTLYFTTWHSVDQHCDQIMRYDGITVSPLPFHSADYDCSDACPIDENRMIFSSTENGNYDLYYFDGTTVSPLPALNTDLHELGADFYSYTEYLETTDILGDVNADGVLSIADLVLFQKWLTGSPASQLKQPEAADLCADQILDVFDLCAMKRALLIELQICD